MPESSNIEIAHTVHEAGEHHHAPGRRRHEVAIEIGEAFLLALVAVAALSEGSPFMAANVGRWKSG